MENKQQNVFTGEFKYTIDKKGRLNIPARFRKYLGDEVVLSLPFSLQPILTVMTQEYFNEVSEDFMANHNLTLDELDQALTYLDRFTVHVSVDNQGRILLPEKHRRLFELEDEVIVLGRRKHFEIWNEVKLDEYSSRPIDKIQEKLRGRR